MLNNKWQLNTSQDWDIFSFVFQNFNTNVIADKTFQVLGLYIFISGYFEEETLLFMKITNVKL